MPRNPRVFTLLAADAIGDDGRQWIEVMPTATKARNGPWFFTITKEDLEAYAESIQAKGDTTPIDYDHTGTREGGSTRASGWFTGQAEVRDGDDGPRLWAEVQWTPAAAEAIRAGEYRFISPEMSFKNRDAKTGLLTKAKEFIAATLTNRPFFRELAPVGSVVWESGEGLEQLRQRLHAALNPGTLEMARYWVMDVAAEKALVQAYGGSGTWVVPFSLDEDGNLSVARENEWVEAKQEWVSAARAALQQFNRNRPLNLKGGSDMHTDILKALGLAEDADETAILTAVKTATETAGKVEALEQKITELTATASEKTEADKRIEKLETELAAERTTRVTNEREQILAQAVREGRIVPAAKETLAAQFGENLDGLKAVIGSFPERSFAEKGSGAGANGPATGQVKEQFVSGRYEPDEESLTLHAKALMILNKTDYTEAEYVAALSQAERELAVTA